MYVPGTGNREDPEMSTYKQWIYLDKSTHATLSFIYPVFHVLFLSRSSRGPCEVIVGFF
jgi:hypothetical protein